MLTIVYSLALLQAAAVPADPPTNPPPAPATPCDSKAHSGFDLWVGEWNVFPNG